MSRIVHNTISLLYYFFSLIVFKFQNRALLRAPTKGRFVLRIVVGRNRALAPVTIRHCNGSYVFRYGTIRSGHVAPLSSCR